MFPFLPFEMVTYILCHCMLEVYGLLLILILQRVTVKEIAISLRRDFGLYLNSVETMIDYRDF